MKTKIIFAVIAAVGSLLLYIFDKDALAMSFVLLVWGVYERFTKEEAKKEVVEEREKRLSAEIKLATHIKENNVM